VDEDETAGKRVGAGVAAALDEAEGAVVDGAAAVVAVAEAATNSAAEPAGT